MHTMDSKLLRRFIYSTLLIFIVSCSEDSGLVTPEDLNIAEEVETFLNEMMDLMEENSINKENIDWMEFRSSVFQEAADSQTLLDSYSAIELALQLLEDKHSTFIAPGGDEIYDKTAPICNDEPFSISGLPANIGYVQIPGFIGIGQVEIDFAESIQESIRTQDNENILGWVVDLRGNDGGNMWPMVAGIGPILGEGTAGFFIDAEDNQISWSYDNGISKSGGSLRVAVSSPYKLINTEPKVAVLLDQSVASSGEAIAVSFIGNKNAKSFGRPTCGLSTANRIYTLKNESILILTVSSLADRNGTKYGIPIKPDETINNPITAFERAVEWIQE